MRVLTAILLRHPNLLHLVEHAYAELTLQPPLDRLRTRCWRGRTAGRMPPMARMAMVPIPMVHLMTRIMPHMTGQMSRNA